MTILIRDLDIPGLRKVWDFGRGGVDGEKCLRELRRRGQVDPCGKPFTWGTVTTWHVCGEYTIAESMPDTPAWNSGELIPPEKRKGPWFHPYIGDLDTGHSFDSLDGALAHAIAFKHEAANGGINAGLNTRADTYFMRAIGAK